MNQLVIGEGTEDVTGKESEFQNRRRCGWLGSICVAINVALMAAAVTAAGGGIGVGIVASAAFYLFARCCFCCPWTCSGLNPSC